ncbi:MAG: 2,3-bisphosphoglycerate-independent phosphoglycerate mutase [Oscillospiraceae bacterium]|jgi:2,3-bisphosphoglycerate-independent phosphoglycerate mutase|nr:2,3-bisphosphoglycerate-independent phosphoglycerate mutase [Oscillospiraceae bacterium]
MKYILLISDGMADRPLSQLGGKTPMETADKPNMNSLAQNAELGTVVNCPEGLPAGSDTAILTIFGCDPLKYYFGRAPLEAAAQGVTVPEGAMAFRCNMACVEVLPDGTKVMKSHSAGGIDGASARSLITDLINDPIFADALANAGVTVYPTDSYRHIAVQSISRPEDSRIEMFAPHDNLGKPLSEILPKGGENAAVLSNLVELSISILSEHPLNKRRVAEGKLPANCVWPWAQGTAANLPSFMERYGKTGAIISAVPLCQGIGILQGLEVIKVPGATGELDTNYEGKAAAALDALNRGLDFAAIHVEAPDECTHNGDVPGKIKAIENIDARVLKPILDGLTGQDFRILVLSDHYTLSESGAHDAYPVPYLIYDSRMPIRNGNISVFTELTAASTGISQESGVVLMDKLFQII